MSPAATGFVVAAAAALALGMLARRGGWIDRRDGEEHRKPRTDRVPLVGGVALFAGALAGAWAGGLGPVWLGLGAVLAVGLVDDLFGLGPGAKLTGQVLAAAVLAWAAPADSDLGWPLLMAALVLGMNVVNTWDHADGSASGLGTMALWGLPPVRGALLAVGLLNLPLWRGRSGERVPWLYLGDAGSHLLGAWLVLHAPARPFLLLPLLDLARVAWLRVREGRAPWVGDRRHLAHRFEALGWRSPWPAVGSLAAATPLVALACGWTGLGVCALLWGLAVLVTPDPAPAPGRAPCAAPPAEG